MTKKLIVDCSTGVVTEVELTADEIAQREIDAVAFTEQKTLERVKAAAAAETKASALSKLEALGLTQEEAAALIS